jgi:hypothetical protein
MPEISKPPTNGHAKVTKKRKKILDNGEAKQSRLSQSSSIIAPSHFDTAVTSTPEVVKTSPEVIKPLADCCVCSAAATSQESVK